MRAGERCGVVVCCQEVVMRVTEMVMMSQERVTVAVFALV